jgi:transposase
MDTIPSTPSLTDTAPATLFAALELSRSTWLVALHAPAVDKVSQHRLEGGDTKGLLQINYKQDCTQAAEAEP